MSDKASNNSIESTIRNQWLDKLWQSLFDDSHSSLMSPGQIRRERRDRELVREIELNAIIEAEAEMNAIHEGLKTLDQHGNVVDTQMIDTVMTHSIIEDTIVEQSLDVGLDSSEKMICSVRQEISVRDLERSLNIRRIAIKAESLILSSEIRPVSGKRVNGEWLRRWREAAGNVIDEALHQLWAKALILEVAQPSSFSLVFVSALQQVAREDMEVLRIAGKYTFKEYIYNPSESYFSTDFHRSLFDVMEDLRLINNQCITIELESEVADSFQHILVCRQKGLKFIASSSTKLLRLPVFKLSRVGRQIMPLLAAEADTAYLFHLAKAVKSQGFEVTLGDWISENGKSQFIEKMRL